MKRKQYPSDMTDKQWAMLAPLIPIARTGGRPRQVNLREVLNAIFYILCFGCRYALLILEKIVGQFPRLLKVFADGGYEGSYFAQKVKDDRHLELEVVKRKQSKDFQVLPWRWIVERTLAWLVRHRRLTIDYEALPAY